MTVRVAIALLTFASLSQVACSRSSENTPSMDTSSPDANSMEVPATASSGDPESTVEPTADVTVNEKIFTADSAAENLKFLLPMVNGVPLDEMLERVAFVQKMADEEFFGRDEPLLTLESREYEPFSNGMREQTTIRFACADGGAWTYVRVGVNQSVDKKLTFDQCGLGSFTYNGSARSAVAGAGGVGYEFTDLSVKYPDGKVISASGTGIESLSAVDSTRTYVISAFSDSMYDSTSLNASNVEIKVYRGHNDSPNAEGDFIAFSSSMDLELDRYRGQSVSLRTTDRFANDQDRIEYTRGVLEFAATDGSSMKLVAANADVNSFQLDVVEPGAVVSSTLSWSEGLQLRCTPSTVSSYNANGRDAASIGCR